MKCLPKRYDLRYKDIVSWVMKNSLLGAKDAETAEQRALQERIGLTMIWVSCIVVGLAIAFSLMA